MCSGWSRTRRVRAWGSAGLIRWIIPSTWPESERCSRSRTPFEWPGDTTVFALMQRIAGEPHPPLRQIDPQIPEGFDRIMDRALAKRPQDRYQKAAEMASDLRNYHSLGGGTEFAKTVPLPVLPTAAAAAEEQKVRSQLIDDLEQFAKNFEAHEKERLRTEQEELLKKEQAWRNWGAAEEQKRESFERAPPGTDAKGDMIPKRSTHYFLTNRADR